MATMTRTEFVQYWRDREAAFLFPREGEELVSASFSPYRCDCGFSVRSAGAMFDHVQGHQEGQS